ncbi:thiol reductant ABC exporter subunit CydD [Acetobacteraceae bacterium KSS8]|uniref:Thiol reductant ABC exporter subunit CydD n=1 Tax=Endosaccharibacter trunci TaxID=2812733 RepID=A0ABT1W6X4_9PROT|nr:thiol reductant ABC exporter subunit CydD [Acetobacteraceae bacterium KSS8]
MTRSKAARAGASPRPDRSAFRAWSKQQSRIGRKLAMPSILLGLVVTCLAIGQAWCIAVVLAHALATLGAPGELPGARMNPAWGPLLGFAVLALVRTALQVAQETRAADAASWARRRLRGEALGAILARGPALLRTGSAGVLGSLVVDRIEALDGFFGRWIPAAQLAILSPAAILFAVAVVQPSAALVLLICGLFVPVAQAVFGIGAAVASRQQFVALARLQARFLDRIRGIATIVLAGRADDEAARLGFAAAELRMRTMRVLRVAFLSSAALDCAFAVALVAIALLDGRALLHGGATRSWLGELLLPRSLFALILVPEFFAPLRTFALAYQDRMQAVGASESLGALPKPPEPDALPAPSVRTVSAHGVSVAFETVSFAWDRSRGPAIDSVSFRIPAQETVILAGPSGSGKSTLIELLLGFVAPDSGRITLNGADIATIVPEALSQMTAWIGQRPLLFSGSIRENVLFAKPDATPQQLEAALRNAALGAFVETLPDGLDTMIGEGGYGLSGGQAQRVAIARAFLRNAPLLLLDEPTAHLDPVTELEILDSLRRLAVGRTVLLASHSTAAHAFSGRRVDLMNGRLLHHTLAGDVA